MSLLDKYTAKYGNQSRVNQLRKQKDWVPETPTNDVKASNIVAAHQYMDSLTDEDKRRIVNNGAGSSLGMQLNGLLNGPVYSISNIGFGKNAAKENKEYQNFTTAEGIINAEKYEQKRESVVRGYGKQAYDTMKNYLSAKAEADKRLTANPLMMLSLSKERNEYKAQADKQKEILEKLGIKGKDFDKYAQYVQEYMDIEATQAREKEIKRVIQKHPVAGSAGLTAATWLTDTVSGYPATLETVKKLGYADKEAPVNTYSNLYALQNASNAVHEGVSDKIDNDVLQWIYDTTNSTATSGLSMVLGGVLGKAFNAGAAEKIGKAITNSSFGAQAFASTIKEAQDRGFSSENAIKTATAAAIAEMAFEEISLDRVWGNFMDARKGVGGFRKRLLNWAVSSGVELSEEVATEFANHASDQEINGMFSDYQTEIRMDVERGMSLDDAVEKAQKNFLYKIALVGLSGFASGGTINAIASTAGSIQYHKTAKNINSNTNLKTEVVDSAKGLDGTTAAEIANSKPVEEINENDMVEILHSMEEVTQKSAHDIAKESLMNAGETEEEAEKKAQAIVVMASQTAPTEAEEKANIDLVADENAANAYVGVLKNRVAGNVLADVEEHNAEVKKIKDRVKGKNGIAAGYNGQEIKVYDFEDVQKGIVATSQGLLDLSEITLPDDMRLLFKNAHALENTKAANAFIDGYKGQSPSYYATGSLRAFMVGASGGSWESFINSKNPLNIKLIEEIGDNAYLKSMYFYGQNSRESSEVKQIDTSKINPGKVTGENVLNPFLELLAKKFNVAINTTESRSKAAGSFVPSDLLVTINKAESNNMVNSAIHEIVGEYAKAYAPEAFDRVKQKVTDFARKEHGDTEYNRMVGVYQNTYRGFGKQTGNAEEANKSYAEASDEFFIDYLAGLIQTEYGLQRLLDYVTEDTSMTAKEKTSVLQSIKDFVKKILDTIKSYLQGVKSNNLGTKAAKEIEKDIDKHMADLEDIFNSVEKMCDAAIAEVNRQINSEAKAEEKSETKEAHSLNVDSEGNNLTEAQIKYFADSKVRDAEGRLLKVMHGTEADFTVFNPKESGGKNGTAEGYGIYFSDDAEITLHYGERQLEGYLNITKPAYDNKKTITMPGLIKLLKATTEYEAKKWDMDIKDTWISNYEDTYSNSLDAAYRSVAKQILEGNDNDKDIIQEVMVGMGIRNYNQAYEFYDILKNTLGFDGFEVKWTHADGTSNVYVALDSNQFKLIDNVNPTDNEDIRYSINVIIGDDGKNYGKGVYLDSTLLTNITDSERREMVRERIKELGGQSFTAFDKNGKAVNIKIEEYNKKFKNANGNKVKVNKDLIEKYDTNTKQEAVVLVDELIETSKFFRTSAAKKSHGWLDDNGNNNWEYWNTYIVDGNGDIWKAALNIANADSGEKVLYDINPITPIKRKGQAVKSATALPKKTIPQTNKQSNNKSHSLNVDSQGSSLSPEQAEFFKDSKARDDEGRLLVMYHGTDAYKEFTVFKPGKDGYLGKGMYFTEKKYIAQRYAEQNGYDGRVYQVYLNIKNPLVVTSDNPALEILGEKVAAKRAAKNSFSTRWLTPADINKLRAKGYDGIIWKYGKSPVEISVWNPNQVKNTDNLKPTESKDIRHSINVTDTEYQKLAETNPEEARRILDAKATEWGAYKASENAYMAENKMVFFHGTSSDKFTVFDKSLLGTGSGDVGFFGKGFYFAFTKGEASTYGRNVMNAYLKMQKPFDFTKEMYSFDGRNDYTDARESLFIVNFVEKFPELAKRKEFDFYVRYLDGKEATISLADYAKIYKDAYKNTKFTHGEYFDDYENRKVYTVSLDDPNAKFVHRIMQTVDERMANNRSVLVEEYLRKWVFEWLNIPRARDIVMSCEFSGAVKALGYDGIIQSETGDEAVVFNENQIKSADLIVKDDAGKVIPLSERFTESKDIRYSLNVDSEGSSLTEAQENYFKDSKIRNAEGRLLRVYHGTSHGGFTEFKNDLNYFTANRKYAERYTRASSNGKAGQVPKVYEGYLNITKPFDITDPEAKRVYIEEYIKGGYAQGISPYASDDEINKYAESIDWTEADNLKEFLDENDYDYDGIILNEGGDITETGTVMRGNSYVTFDSNQFKNVDNLNPTKSRDIRYSLDVEDWEKDFFAEMTGNANVSNILTEGLKSLDNIKLNKKITDKIAREVREEYKSRIKVADLSDSLEKVFSYMLDTGAPSYGDLVNIMKEVAMPVVEQATEIMPEEKRIWDDFKEKMKGYRIKLNPQQKAEVANTFGTYYAFKNDMFGNLIFSESGTELDSIWTEICDASGGFLDYAENPANQPMALYEFVEALKPTPANIYGADQEEAAYDVALTIFRKFLVEQEYENNPKLRKEALKLTEAQQTYKKRIKENYDKKFKEATESLRREKEINMKRLATEIKYLNEEEKAAIEGSIEQALILRQKRQYEWRLQKLRETKNDEINRKLSELKARQRASISRRVEGRQLTLAKARIRKNVEKLNSMLAHGTENRHIPKNMVLSTIAMLESIDINTGNSKGMAEYLQKMEDIYRGFKDSDVYTDGEKAASFDYDERTAANIEALRKLFDGRNYTQLSLSELQQVIDITNAVITQAENANKLLGKAKREYATDFARTAAQEVRNAKAIDTRFMTNLDHYFTNHLNAYREFRKLSGYEDGKLMELYYDLDKGQQKQLQVMKDINAIFDDVLSNQKEVKRLTSTKKEDLVDSGLKDEKGNSVMITRAERLSLIMHSYNKSNMQHLLYGGISVPDLSYKDPKQQRAHAQTYFYESQMEVRNAILDKNANKLDLIEQRATMKVKELEKQLSPWEKQFLEATKEMFWKTTGRLINETSLELKGYTLARVANYFPIKTDTDYTKSDVSGLVFDGTIEGMGFLKERRFGRNAMMLEDITDTILRQTQSVAKYVGLAIPVRNFNMVWNAVTRSPMGNADTLKKAISVTWGAKNTDYIVNLMKDLNGRRDGGEPSGFDILRGRFAGAVLTLNPSVAIKQAASYFTAGAKVGNLTLAKTLKDLGKGFILKKGIPELEAINPLLWYRNQGNATQELADMKASGFGKNLPIWAQKALNWVQFMDTGTVRTLEYAAKNYVDAEYKGPKNAEYWQRVSDVFTSIVEETQPNYTVLQQADIIRDPNRLRKALVMFKTQPLQNFGTVYDAIGEYAAKVKKGNKAQIKEAGKHLAWALSSQIASAVTFSAMAILADMILHKQYKYKDDDKSFWEMILAKFGAGVRDCFLGAMLWMQELYQVADYIFNPDNETYYGVNVSYLAEIEDIVKAIKKLGKDTTGRADAITEADRDKYNQGILIDVGNLVNYFGQFVGVPLGNIKNMGQSLILYAIDLSNGTIGEAELSREVPNQYERMYEALQNKDSERYNTLFDEMVTKKMRDAAEDGKEKDQEDIEKSVETSAKKYIKDGYNSGELTYDEAYTILTKEFGMEEDDAYFKLDEWLYKSEGHEDYTRYIRLADAVNGQGDIQAEIDKLTAQGIEANTIKTQLTGILRDSYNKNTLSKEKITGILTEYEGLNENDVYYKFKEWDFKKTHPEESFSKYDAMNSAIKEVINGSDNRKPMMAEIEDLMKHGVEAKSLQSQLTKEYKPLYLELKSKGKASTLKNVLIAAYMATGLSRDDAIKRIDNWK